MGRYLTSDFELYITKTDALVWKDARGLGDGLVGDESSIATPEVFEKKVVLITRSSCLQCMLFARPIHFMMSANRVRARAYGKHRADLVELCDRRVLQGASTRWLIWHRPSSAIS